MNNKSNNLDTVLAVVGIIVSLVAGFDILGAFENFFSNDLVKYFNFALGVLILTTLFLKKRNAKTSFRRLNSEDIVKDVTAEASKRFNKVAIYNPNEVNSISMLIEYFNTHKYGISIIGEASNLIGIFNQVSTTKLQSFTKLFHVLSFGQDASIIMLYSDNSHNLSMFYSNDESAFNIAIQDKELAKEINKVFNNRENLYNKSIRLDQISKPSNFLDIVNQEKERYLNNFKNLKSGYISFYGTEVQNIQSGWIENGDFQNIKTLDLTGNPGILLTRDRYIAANRKFTSNGGTIERVYLIDKVRLKDDVFCKNLKAAIELQKGMGVNIGLQFLGNLSPREKQDFILYDNFASLVEEKQANSDYSFGKSTAYFSKDRIQEYVQMFNDVWNGKNIGINAVDNLGKTLKLIEKK